MYFTTIRIYDNYMRIMLSQIMYDKNLSVRQVEIMTGVSKSTIHRIMNGEVSPTSDTLERVAKGLKIHICDLIESDYL